MEKTFGKHSVRAIFLARPKAVRRLLLLEGAVRYLGEFVEGAERVGVAPEILGRDQFLRRADLTEDDKHQGVCAFTEPRRVFGERDLAGLEGSGPVLALDQVSDPQNLGTMLRNAAFFGVEAVLLMKNRSVDLTPTAARVAVGGAELVKIVRVTNLARSLGILKDAGYWVYGLDERGEKTLAETEFPEKTVLVVGAEGEGLRQRTKKLCDALVRIPGGRPGLESLNAGVATAVALAELSRR